MLSMFEAFIAYDAYHTLPPSISSPDWSYGLYVDYVQLIVRQFSTFLPH